MGEDFGINSSLGFSQMYFHLGQLTFQSNTRLAYQSQYNCLPSSELTINKFQLLLKRT